MFSNNGRCKLRRILLDLGPSGAVWLSVFLIAAVCFFVHGLARSEPSLSSQFEEASASLGPRPCQTTKNIEEIKVGERVLTDLPDQLRELAIGDPASIPVWDRLDTDVDPTAWRMLQLEMTGDNDDHFEIVLLRPVAWVDEFGAEVGGTIHLVLTEQGLDGPADVIAIEPCPPIAPQPGRVVTGTITHICGGILILGLEGIDQPIGVTKTHLIYALDRNEFVPAGDLTIGERLRHLGGAARIASIERLPEEQRVYNLEIHGEHVYRVTGDGVLVHNECPNPVSEAARNNRRNIDIAEGHRVRIDTSTAAEGGYHAHVYDASGAEVARVNGFGGYSRTHGNSPLLRPNELPRPVRNDVNRIIRYWGE